MLLCQRQTLFVTAALLLGTIAAHAQSNYGSIRGSVLDPSGAAVPNARVKIVDVGTGAVLDLVTGQDGTYSASSMRPVLYSIAVEAAGFKKGTVEGVKVDTSKVSGVDVILVPGSVQESVTVTAAAPLMQTENGQITATVNQRAIQDTPLNGRNVLELALTLPGVTGNAGSELGSFFNAPPLPGRELIVNGGRPGTTQFIADGQNVTSVGTARTSVSFTPDTIQEFSILQSNYSAQYSQAGGGIIQQTTKSGTNDYHGVVYWFHRQKSLTANPFLSTRLPQFNNDNRSPLRRQQLGLALGGPVEIPKVYRGKNKTFFFASYEPTRQVQGNLGASFERVPTDLELNGDFSKSVTIDAGGVVRPYPQIYNHFTKSSDGTLHYLLNPNYKSTLAAGNANPLGQYVFGAAQLFNSSDPDPARVGRVLVDANGRSYINPAAQALARALYPRPNIPIIQSGSAAGANFAYFQKTYNVDDRYSVRMDHRITDNHTITGRYTYQPLYADRFFRNADQPGTSDTSLSRQIVLSETGILRSNLVNEFRAGYVFGNFARNFPSDLLNVDLTSKYLDIGGPGKGTPNFLGFGIGDFFSQGGPANNAVGFGRIGFNGLQNVGKNTEHSYTLSDDLSWIKGKQSLRFGVLGGLQQSNGAAPGYGYQAGGRWNFGTGVTSDAVGCNLAFADGPLPSDCRNATARTGDPFAGFLLGVPTNVLAYENVAQPYYYRWFNLGGYVQDDWKIRQNLTVNVGLRYQFQSPRWEKYNRQGQLNLSRLEPNPFQLDANGNPLLAPVFEFAGYGGRSSYLTPAQYKDFEPRFGFAFTPDFDWNKGHRFVIRGGYGITHSVVTGRSRTPYPNLGGKADAFRAYNVGYGTTDLPNPSNINGCGLAICSADVPAQFGYNNVVYIPDPTIFQISGSGEIHPGDVGKTSNGVPRPDARYGFGGFVFDQHSKTPMIQNFGLEIQHEVMRNTVMTIGWRGNHGTHLFSTPRELNVNPFNGTRNYPGFNGGNGPRIVLVDETASGSIYHAGIFELERRFSAGLQFRFNYTYSKSLDDSSGGLEPDFTNLAGQDASSETIKKNAPQNSFGTTKERSVSNFDYNHVLNYTGLYELPFGKGKRFLGGGRWTDLLVGGYQVTGLMRIVSGAPVFLDLGDSNQLGFASNSFQATPRPNLIAGVPLKNPDWTAQNAPFTPYLNPRAFSVPEPGTFGNAPRNFSQLRMPWTRQVDASVFKSFYPFENRNRFFQLRAEGFNVFNMKSFGFAGFQTSIFNGLAQNKPGEPNRYANLTPKVWDAIIKSDPAGLTGATTAPSAQALSELGVYTDLVGRYRRDFYTLGSASQNTIQARVLQFALKFYF